MCGCSKPPSKNLAEDRLKDIPIEIVMEDTDNKDAVSNPVDLGYIKQHNLSYNPQQPPPPPPPPLPPPGPQGSTSKTTTKEVCWWTIGVVSALALITSSVYCVRNGCLHAGAGERAGERAGENTYLSYYDRRRLRGLHPTQTLWDDD